MNKIKPYKLLDARGLVCPMPVVKTRKLLDEIEPCQVLEVITTDPASRSDIPALINRLGHELIETGEREKSLFLFKIKKGGRRC